MKSLYTWANRFDKENLYDYYLTTIDKPLPYEKITRKRMLETIVAYYNINDHLFYALSAQEISLLKRIVENEEKILTDENKTLIIELSSKLLISFSYFADEIYIYDEFYDAIKRAVEKMDTVEGKKILELQQVCIGLCNAYGILTKEEFYDCIHRYLSSYTNEQIESVIKSSDYFKHRIAILEITYDNIPITLFTYHDVEEVADFLDAYIDVLTLPKYEFNYDEIMEYAVYELNYKNDSLQRLLKRMREINSYFYEDQFLNLIQNVTNLLLDKNMIKKYIYNHYPHYERNADKFFELMDLCDEMGETLNTWAARGYPVSRMTDVLSGLQIDTMKKLERAYHYKTGLSPEDDFNSFLDFIESVTDEEVDEYLYNKEKKQLN